MKYTAVLSKEAKEGAAILSGGFDTVLLPADDEIARPVSCHADMILCVLKNVAVMPLAYVKKNRDIAERISSLTGLRVISDPSPRGKVYPNDVLLNVLVTDAAAFSNRAYTSPCITELLLDYGIRHVNVKQGYAACSSLSFGNALITADRGMASAAEAEGIDVLLISREGIALPGYNEGFIGGASGVCEREVYFLGNIECHPDGGKIRAFIKKHGFECVSLYDGPLCDYGGIKFIENRAHASDSNA